MLTGIEARSQKRRKRMVAHVARNFTEAEEWDLHFWQQQTPQDRVSALSAIHCDVELVEHARRQADAAEKKQDGNH